MFVSIVATLVLSPQRMHHHHVRAKKAVAVDEEAAIRATGAKVKRSFETKNYSLFRSLLTSNFQQEMPNHQMLNVRQTMAQMRKSLDPLSDIKCTLDLQTIKVDGRSATVEDRFTMTGKAGKHSMRVEGSETVSLKKTGGQWLAYYDKLHDQSVAMDGHIVSHMP